MASKNYAILDMKNDDDELQFQDFGLSGNNTGHDNSGRTQGFSNFPDSPGHQGATNKLGDYHDDDEIASGNINTSQNSADDDGSEAPKSDKSFWTFEYYQQFFDVDSKQVGDRIMWSMVPKPGVNFLEMYIRPKPDLYGPFWVCLTLVFAAAIAGNVSNYLQTQGEQTIYWRYDFHKVSLAAGMVFTYGWLLPLLIWSGLRYHSTVPPLALLELVCLYGYSLSVLVPVCIVWTVPMVWLRWCVGIVGVVLSGVVLARAVWEGLKDGIGGSPVVVDGSSDGDQTDEDSGAKGKSAAVMKNIAIVLVVIVVVMHVAIAMGFMLYFFGEPGGPKSTLAAVQTSVPSIPEAAIAAAVTNPGPVLSVKMSTVKPALQAKDVSPTKREVIGGMEEQGEKLASMNLVLSNDNLSQQEKLPNVELVPAAEKLQDIDTLGGKTIEKESPETNDAVTSTPSPNKDSPLPDNFDTHMENPLSKGVALDLKPDNDKSLVEASDTFGEAKISVTEKSSPEVNKES